MFKLLAVICFMQVGELKQDLCFQSSVPLEFKNKVECTTVMNNLANYMDKDLVKRQASIVLYCKQDVTPIDV